MIDRSPGGLPTIRSQWDFGDPAGSEVRFRDLAEQARAAGQDGYAVEARTQVARSLGLQRKFADGHAELDAIAAELGADRGPTAPIGGSAGVRFLLERGRLLRSGGDPQASKPYFLAAWQLGQAVGDDDLAVDAAHMLAILEGGGEAANEWNSRALDLAETTDDQEARRWRASLLNNMGWDAYGAGEFDRALGLFQRALEARREMGSSESDMLIARWCIAKSLRSLGRVEEALAEQRILEAEFASPDGYVFEEIGECLLALGRSDEARPYFAEAHGILGADAWLTEAQPERIARLASLGAIQS